MENGKTEKKSCNVFYLAIIIIVGLQIVTILFVSDVFQTKIQVTDPLKEHQFEQITDDQPSNGISITKSYFGRTTSGEAIYKYSFVNKNKAQLEVLNLGGIIVSIRMPCRHGHLRDVIVGFNKVSDYTTGSNKPYFGAIIGRVANRISNSSFVLDGKTYYLYANEGNNHLHGGRVGWDKKIWHVDQYSEHIELFHTSPDGDEGYPGEVKVKVTYQLTNQNEVIANFTAQAYKKKTPINLTLHPYFNLGGELDNCTILDHEVTIPADQYIVNDPQLIPTGEIAQVEDTSYDLRSPVVLAERIYNITDGPVLGYDNTFALRGPTGKRLAAKVYHPRSGRVMKVYTNQPGLQFYTGNFLNVTCGKSCHRYGQHSGFCMETQNYVNAINQPNFPDSVLRPGSVYTHQVWYSFSTEG